MKRLLSKENFQKLQIVCYVLSSSKQLRKPKEIEEEFNLSSPTVESRCEELNNDIHQVMGETANCRLEHSFNEYRMVGNTENIFNLLLLKYGKQSRTFRLLHMIVNQKDVSIVKYLEVAHVGESNAYNMKDKLKIFLKDFQLDVGYKSKLIGEEYDIRQLLYSIYYTIFKNLEVPFETYVENEAKQLLDQLLNEELYSFELSEGDKSKLLMYLMVTVVRINHQYFLHEKNPYISPERKSVPTSRFIQNRFNLSDKRANLEYQLIKSFLEIERILPYSSTVYMLDITQQIYNEASEFLGFLKQYRIDKSDIQALEIINFGLQNIFKNVFLSASKRVDHLFYLSEADVLGSSTFQFEICYSVLKTYLKKRGSFYSGLLNNHSLIRQMLVSLETVFETSGLRYEVAVRLEFGLGTLHQHYIKDLIQHKLGLPIVIVDSSKEKSDILVSDRPLNLRDKTRVLVWNDPPTSSDWEVLMKFIREELGLP